MTINERAKEFAQENSKGYNPRLVAHAYHCGAVDQQNIDIEKAVEWWVAKLNSTEPVDFEKWAEDFRKAMKGE